MTDHEGIFTFVDCPDRKKTDLGTMCGHSKIYCYVMIRNGLCKRGYAR